MTEIEIVYEDEAVLVCKKPAGVATQTKRLGQKDMESMLKNYRVSRGEPPYIGVVHRLDQPVSGIMVFAKTREAAAELGRQFGAKQTDKCYYAMTDGVPPKARDNLVDYLYRDGRTNMSAVVEPGREGAKRAELSYQVLESGGGRAVLAVKLFTGRHHQIRVQLSHAGFPIVGDLKYNFKEHLTPSGEGLALCACQIGFRHPVTHKKAEYKLGQPFHIAQS